VVLLLLLLPLDELPDVSGEVVLPELLPVLPGDSAPPIAEPAPDKPKYENTL